MRLKVYRLIPEGKFSKYRTETFDSVHQNTHLYGNDRSKKETSGFYV